jgi:hypothetical protein
METWFGENWWWFVLIAIWSISWKAFALWKAAKKDDKIWFVALIILNTAGILEIFYIFFFSKREKLKDK